MKEGNRLRGEIKREIRLTISKLKLKFIDIRCERG